MFTGKIITSFGILVGIIVVRILIKKAFKLGLSKVRGRLTQKHLARTNTVKSLLVNIINFVILLVGVLTILSNWGVDIAPILAGIGIFGIALSFGSQSLVRDFISGFFIILEDQFRIGDTVRIDKYEGVVKKITIRSTQLKDKEGNRIYIPNSKIDIVTRFEPKSLQK